MKNNKLSIFLRNPNGVEGTTILDSGYEFVNEKGEKQKRILTDKKEVKEVDVKSGGASKIDIILNSKNMHMWQMDITEHMDVESIKKWASNHSQLGLIDDNKSTTFVYRFDDEVVKNTHDNDEQRVEVYAKYNTLDKDQRNAVAIHFGVSFWDKSESELKNELVSLDGGIISGIKAAREEFLERIDIIMDEVSLNFKCAVLNNIITTTNDNVYMLNGEMLGASQEGAISMLKQRDELYAVIKRELTGKGKYLTTNANKKAMKQDAEKAERQGAFESDLDDLGIDKPKSRGRQRAEA